MPVTLADLRALLERCPADSPAILRLPEDERNVYGLAQAYLSRRIALGDDHPEADGWPLVTTMRRGEGDGRYAAALRCKALDMRDPGTAHALLVALALAMGLDPGVGGLAVMWGREGNHYTLQVTGQWRGFFASLSIREGGSCVHAPTVAYEPDPIRALELAVWHVLGAP